MSATAVIYTRVSSDEQVTGTSLDSQRRDCIAAAQARGLTVAEIFTDAGFSAKTADRPSLQSALEYCRKQRPKALIVWKLDRLSRNTADGLIIRQTLARHGTELISATESITADPTGDLVSTLLLGVAQFDNAQRSMRCRRGMVETAMQGGWCHKAPVGYIAAKNSDGLPVLHMDPTIGPALQHTLKDYAAGIIGKSEYFRRCAAIGITRQTADKIPTKEVYAGIIREKTTGGQPVRAAFDGLITPDELQRIQANRKKRMPRITGIGREDIYRGIVRCAECGHSLTPYEQKGLIYWKCQHCRVSIRDRKLYEHLNAIILRAPDLAKLLKAIGDVARIMAKQRIDTQRQQRTTAEAEAAAAQRKLDRLVDLLVDERIDQATYDRKSAEYRCAIERAKNLNTDTNFDINATLTHLEKTIAILSDPRQFLTAITPSRAQTLLRLIFGEFLLDPSTRTVTVSTRTDALYALLQQTKTAADPAAVKSSNFVSWWTNVPKLLTAIGEKCRAIAVA